MKSLILIWFFSLSAFINAQKGDLNLSRWHVSNKIEESDYQLIKKAKFYFFISNDNENFYINIKVTDQEIQKKILEDGLTIWINMDDKPLAKMGVRFPIGSNNQGSSKGRPGEGRVKPEVNTVSPVDQANTIELIGFISEQERHFPAENPDNFRGAVKFDERGILFYKMIMPVAKLPLRNSKEKRNGAMPFSLGFEFGYSPQTSASKGTSQRGSSELHWINHVKLAVSK